jgi:hypothetical protein
MKRIYTPTRSVDDWQALLADPEKQWKTGYSARSLAYAWEESDGFPATVRSVLSQTFPNIEPLIILPEHQVALPGGNAASQNDAWVLAKSNGELISIAVEGKVAEPFGPTVGEWGPDASAGRQKRFAFLKELLQLDDIPESTRYQLLHRTASAVLEAQRFNAQHAVLLVHTFSPENRWFEDFSNFVNLFGNAAHVDRVVQAEGSRTPALHLAWAHGDEAFLKR